MHDCCAYRASKTCCSLESWLDGGQGSGLMQEDMQSTEVCTVLVWGLRSPTSYLAAAQRATATAGYARTARKCTTQQHTASHPTKKAYSNTCDHHSTTNDKAACSQASCTCPLPTHSSLPSRTCSSLSLSPLLPQYCPLLPRLGWHCIRHVTTNTHYQPNESFPNSMHCPVSPVGQ